MSIEDLKIKMQLADDMKGLDECIYRVIDTCNSINSRLQSLVNNPFYSTEATNDEKARVDNITSIYTQFMAVLEQLK